MVSQPLLKEKRERTGEKEREKERQTDRHTDRQTKTDHGVSVS